MNNKKSQLTEERKAVLRERFKAMIERLKQKKQSS